MTNSLLAFLIVMVAIVGASHIDTRSEIDQVCRAKNIVTKELNKRVVAHKADSQGLLDFLEDARTARLADYERDGASADLKAARKYGGITAEVKRKLRYRILKLDKC